MSDILSQDEVDALLSAVSSGDLDEGSSDSGGGGQASYDTGMQETVAPDMGDRSVSIYDFRRPDRVSKDQMRTLQNLHENYARLLSTTLTSYLRSLVEIELVSVDQLTYSEFIMSISNPSCIYIFQMEPLEGKAIFEINPSLVYFMVDRLFGGQGRPFDPNRELTGIEENVIVKITERALENLKEVWEHIGIFSPKLDSYETNPQFVQIAPPGETIILISLEVNMQNGSGLMSLCFPYILLEGVINKLSGESWIASQRSSTLETKKIMENEISPTSVDVQACIGETKISVRDYMQLVKGDVIVLDKLVGSDLTVKVNDVPKMRGRPGKVGRKKAVKITSFYSKEELGYG